MRSFFFACVALTLGCGGNVRQGVDVEDLEGGLEGGRVPRLPDGAVYVDPMCPDAGPPEVKNTCDVLRPLETCAPGTACYPVTHPPERACDTERYGSACVPPGTGKQGTPCGSGARASCAPGFICVITGGTTECAKACALGMKGGCESGYVCEPIDVPGYAVCL